MVVVVVHQTLNSRVKEGGKSTFIKELKRDSSNRIDRNEMSFAAMFTVSV